MTFNRNASIGATDAKRILEGDWLSLWLEKTGRADPEDLIHVFKVQLGKWTEEFHLKWISKTLGPIMVFKEGDPDAILTSMNGTAPMHVTRDGMLLNGGQTVEVKHSSTHKTTAELARYYMPQIQHGLAITGHDFAWFSAIRGNDEPEPVPVNRDEAYISELLELERQFWWHVSEGIEPETLPTSKLSEVKAMATSILVDGMTAPVDMTGKNEWASLAAEYIELKPKADRCAEVSKLIKELVPATAPKAYGHGVHINRTKKGLTLTIKEDA